MRLAVLTPDPDYPEPWRWAFDIEAGALIAAGATVDPVAWTAAGDLSGYDLILPLVAWGYHLRYAEWLEFLSRVERAALAMLNPSPLLRWNGDKGYLAELRGKGIPTVPTLSVQSFCQADLAHARRLFGKDRLVIKPPVSASATGTYRLDPNDPLPAEMLGRPTIIQPFIETIATIGEYSVMLFDGAFSHALVKRPTQGDFRVQPHLGGSADACEPPDGAVALATAALAGAPAVASYARVDIIADEVGTLRIMELELIEPALYLEMAPDRGAAFAAAVRSAAERTRK